MRDGKGSASLISGQVSVHNTICNHNNNTITTLKKNNHTIIVIMAACVNVAIRACTWLHIYNYKNSRACIV